MCSRLATLGVPPFFNSLLLMEQALLPLQGRRIIPSRPDPGTPRNIEEEGAGARQILMLDLLLRGCADAMPGLRTREPRGDEVLR